MKYLNWVLVILIMFSLYLLGYEYGNNTKRVELWLFQERKPQDQYSVIDVVTVTNRLFKDMEGCSKSGGILSINHTYFESELICYNGFELVHKTGEWQLLNK